MATFSNIKTRPFFFFYGTVFLGLIFVGRLIRTQQLPDLYFFIEAFSTIGLLIGVFYLVHKWGWKYPPVKLLYEVENVAGIYSGTLTTSNKDEQGKYISKEIEAEITQPTASDIHINLLFKDDAQEVSSKSESTHAKLYKTKNGNWKLEYSYINKPNELYDKEVLQIHEGFTALTFNKDLNILTGNYFTHQNKSNGNINLQKRE